MKTSRAILPSLAAFALCTTTVQADPVHYFAQVFGISPSGFTGQRNTNQGSASSNFSGGDAMSSVQWSGSADLSNGRLRGVASASISGSSVTSTVISGFGDTIEYTGTALGNFGFHFNLSRTFPPPTTTLTASFANTATLGVYFLQPGSFDSGFVTSQNLLYSRIYGIGPNWSDPFGLTGGVAGIISGNVSITVPVALPSGFQVIAFLQPYGTLFQGVDPLSTGSFLQDIGNTLDVSLAPAAGTTVTTAGGLPVGAPAAIPEPSTWMLGAFGLVALAVRRRTGRHS